MKCNYFIYALIREHELGKKSLVEYIENKEQFISTCVYFFLYSSFEFYFYFF